MTKTKVEKPLEETLAEIWRDERKPQYVDYDGVQYRAVEHGKTVKFIPVSPLGLYSSGSMQAKK